MGMLSIFLITAAGAFSISDTTDNITGEREVYAMQIAKEREPLGFIYLRCDAGTPRVMLNLYDVPDTEWTFATLDSLGHGDEEPLAFRKMDDLFKYSSYQGNSDQLVETLSGLENAAITARYDHRKFTFTFATSGIRDAWDRVKKHCPTPDV